MESEHPAMKTFEVSRYSDPGRPHLRWQVNGTAPDGRRVRPRFRTRDEAQAWADDANREVKATGWQAMGLSDEARVEAAKCLEELAPTGRTLTEAVKFYLRHLAETERSVTVTEAVEELMEFKTGKGLSPRHAVNLRYFFKPLSEKFGGRKVSTLTRRELEAWLNARKLHPVSYKSTIRHLSILFNHCVKMGTASENPVKDIQPPKVAPEEVGILTPGAMRALLDLVKGEHPDMLAAVALQGFAGLRRAEVRRLTWDAVNLAEGHITLAAGKAKTRNRRVIPISANLAAWLAPVRAESGPVVPKCFDPCAAELRRKLMKAGHGFPDNALRHSFVSYRLAESGDENRTANESGHAVAVLHAHYKGLVSAKTAAAWWGILPTDATGGNIVAMPAPAATPWDLMLGKNPLTD